MKPEMKKLIIANLPYLLFVYLFGKLDHNREAGDRAFIFNIGKIAPFNSHYFGQHLARQVLCFPRSFHICAESFKAGAIFNFRHITSPIYIV